MRFRAYWSSLTSTQRQQLASACGTSSGHLRNISYGYRPCAEKLAIAIERETGGAVRCEELRPDVDWQVVRSRRAVRQEHTNAPS